VKLTAHIRLAADGWLKLEVDELPQLEAHARAVREIPDAVRTAAAVLTGKPRQEFEIDLRY